jgi:membrane-associated protease RseP (regulator of RpoE activity)
MPASPSEPSSAPEPGRLEAVRGRALFIPLFLFVATCGTVLWTGATLVLQREPASLPELLTGWVYALPLMGILTCHEFGHYIAARRHGVAASLPYFLPLYKLSPFGTLGAVITMPPIRSRNALLDIGAAGPLAGIAVAIPVLCVGLALSPVEPQPLVAYIQEGQSILYWLLKRVVSGHIPDGHDVMLHPTAEAGWVGLFVTMINLLPWGQLDGGHIAYALLGPAQNRLARKVRLAVFGFFLYNLATFVAPVLLGTSDMPLEVAVGNSLTWLVWFFFLGLLGRFSGHDHPPVEGPPLSPRRRGVAIGCLVLFVLLFMPTPWASHPGSAEPADAAAPALSRAIRAQGSQ